MDIINTIPPKALRFMGEADDQFFTVCDSLAAKTLQYVSQKDGLKLLDVGCGYGRLAYGLRRAGFQGAYTGLDILSRQVNWLSDNFESASGKFDFKFLNLFNERYNTQGEPLENVAFPFEENSFDCITTFSVFTHMYEQDVRLYFQRVSKLLKDGGTWITTFFRLPDDFALDTQPAGRIQFKKQVGPNSYIHDLAEPLSMIAYKEAFLRSLFASVGLTVEKLLRGSWRSADHDGEYQDLFILRKGVAKEQPAVSSRPAASSTTGPVCNICGANSFGRGPEGRMADTGALPCCKACGALERQRIVRKVFQSLPIGALDWRRVLQFSPDNGVDTRWFRSFELSVYGTESSLDLQQIDRPNGHYDLVTLNHVLEFIPDDKRGFDEMLRVLSPNGMIQICLSAPFSRETSVDYPQPFGAHGAWHLYGRDFYQRFHCAEKGVALLAVEEADPVTGAREAVHFLMKDPLQAEKMRTWLTAYSSTAKIVDYILP